jgi:hypothetical protein
MNSRWWNLKNVNNLDQEKVNEVNEQVVKKFMDSLEKYRKLL